MGNGFESEELEAIAVIGMACRFPGAANLEAFWRNLQEGVASVKSFTDEELSDADPELLKKKNYVKVRGLLDDIERFDADFFNVPPLEAGLMDPQQRLFLECAWNAMEHAGYDPDSAGGHVGVFAGSDTNAYLEMLKQDTDLANKAGEIQFAIGNFKDHLAPRVSYLMNLRGPSVPVQTACSTSLVAIHLASQSLLNFECNMALAGGVSIPVPYRTGYLYAEGGSLSPDGHCRAFDADARGTALGSGVGAVILKRLEDALEDGDTIHAIIRGSAINNDGAAKIGYTAPSVEGQRRVIRQALTAAEVEADEITYVEAHGTGTSLGDPIEVEALTQAFRKSSDANQFCALGSVKTNLGHCNAAAGVAGFIKTVLCLENSTLVPSLNYDKPNPRIDFPNSPFYVNSELKPWKGETRFAGISSFGIGGTNAHLVLQSPPVLASEAEADGKKRIFTLSAQSETALSAVSERLADHLEQHADLNAEEVAFTLQMGRKPLAYRRTVVADSLAEAAKSLRSKAVAQKVTVGEDRDVVFLFPGQGADYSDMGRALYQKEAVFREAVDECTAILHKLLDANLAEFMFAQDEAKLNELQRPKYWQPALFVSAYAQACLWRSWGVEPKAMMGHSIGEYVAAVLAGVFSLENALALLALRGKGTEDLEAGSMMAVVMPEAEIRPYMQGPISLAAVNGPQLCVLSGPNEGMNDLRAKLSEAGKQVISLSASHAFHSQLMEPLMEPMTELAKSFKLAPPKIPIISNLTGDWMTEEQATDPGYWAQHMRNAVRFHEGLISLADQGVCLEVGAGKVLSNLARRHPQITAPVVTSLAGDHDDAQTAMLHALGGLWCAGVAVNWADFYDEETPRRVPLPINPFEGKAYWLAPRGHQAAAAPAIDLLDFRQDSEDWFYQPFWRQAPHGSAVKFDQPAENEVWLALLDGFGVAEQLAARLEGLGRTVIRVQIGEALEMVDELNYTADPAELETFNDLFSHLLSLEIVPTHLIHAWSLDAGGEQKLETALKNGYESLIHLAQAVGNNTMGARMRVGVLSNGVHQVLDEAFQPEKAAMLGAVRVIPGELPQIVCKSIDLPTGGQMKDQPVDSILADILDPSTNDITAYRHGLRWLPTFEQSHAWSEAHQGPQLREKGVYLITNGLQEIGFYLAEHMAAQYGATVVLADRSFFPPEAEWKQWIEEQGGRDIVSRKIVRFRGMEQGKGKVHTVSVDLSDLDRMAKIRAAIENEHGAINGVIHLDGDVQDGLILAKHPSVVSKLLNMKIREARVLGQSFEDLDFLTFFSENPGEGGFGQVEKAAAFNVLSHLAIALRREKAFPVLSIEWGTRNWTNLMVEELPDSDVQRQLRVKRTRYGMSPDECIAAFKRLLGATVPVVIVATRDYRSVLEQQRMFSADYFREADRKTTGGSTKHERPEMSAPYAEPESELEQLIVEKWQEYFDIEPIGINDNFFELGGHSLLAVQLLNGINETLSSKLTLNRLFDAPTIAELALLVSQEQMDADEAARLEDMLAEIEGLSEDEIDQVLGR